MMKRKMLISPMSLPVFTTSVEWL